VEQFGAGSGAEGVETLAKPALQLMGLMAGGYVIEPTPCVSYAGGTPNAAPRLRLSRVQRGGVG